MLYYKLIRAAREDAQGPSEGGAPLWLLLRADAMKILPLVSTRSVPLVIGDAPYGEVNRPSNGLRTYDKGFADEATFDIIEFAGSLRRVAMTTVIFCGTMQLSPIIAHFRATGPRVCVRSMVWSKTNPSPQNGNSVPLSAHEHLVYAKRPGATFNGHCEHSVMQFPGVHHTHRLHPTEKPVALLEHLIEMCTNPGDIVLDPCMGSGSAGEAALRLGRRFVGIEINSNCFATAERRLETVTSQVLHGAHARPIS